MILEPQGIGSLYEYSGRVIIGDESIDRYGHVNNGAYFPIYEDQRALYMASLGLELPQLESRFSVSPFIRDYSGQFLRQVLSGDNIDIFTSAVVQKANLEFIQRMTRDDLLVGNYRCTVYMVTSAGRPTRVPAQIRSVIETANTGRR